MESDESRQSSSSNSSDDSDNSRPSTPVVVESKSPGERASSRSSGRHSVKSQSKTDSESSSSSSENDDDEESKNIRNKRSSRSSGSDKEGGSGSVSRNQSISPVRKSGSSRNSSVSSCRSNTQNQEENALNVSHEDLSDVSDLESEKRDNSKQSIGDEEDGENSTNGKENVDEKDDQEDAVITDLRQKLDQKKNLLKAMEQKEKTDMQNGNSNGNMTKELDDLVKTHDEDALDFEAEEGECQELSREEEPNEKDLKEAKAVKSDLEEGEELEEGEVTDEEDKRPEETEPKPICRFYTRGQCTWGMSCRFLHPGVTDKGNYTMFDMVRPVPVPHGGRNPPGAFGSDIFHDFRTERPPLHHRQPIHHHPIGYPPHHDPRAIPPAAATTAAPLVDAPLVESAWERGLRTAKEMMRKANKRKEQDMDFEDKKMNLTLSQDELEKDPYYIKDRTSPIEIKAAPPPFARHPVGYHEPDVYSPSERFGRPQVPPYDEVDPYGRTTRYRELPPHRMPQYEDERRVRPAREVIVQRAEPAGRADEWNDPWMRSKSPGGRGDRDKRRRDRQSYSSHSSYTSSSTSQSDSSSETSRSPSPTNRRRFTSNSHRSPVPRRHIRPVARSPSPRKRRSPSSRHSPQAKRRGNLSPSPLVDRRSGYSPLGKRKRAVSPPRRTSIDKRRIKRRRGSSSSGSGSSDSSESDSNSESGSSSSESSSRSRENTPIKRGRAEKVEKVVERKASKKVEATKKRSPISIEIKKQSTVGASALVSPTHSNSSSSATRNSKGSTRREELLKQLKAVEDAIAKKRSKLT